MRSIFCALSSENGSQETEVRSQKPAAGVHRMQPASFLKSLRKPVVVRFREHLRSRHSGGCIHSMAPDCRNERFRKYNTRNRKAAAGRHGADRTG